MTRQFYPALDAATEAALRASIQRFGVLVPPTVDQHGEIIDGHHRSRIAADLGVPFAPVVREVSSEEEAREIARTLNEDRRMLSREQRLPVVAVLKELGHSNVAIGKALGVTEGTVRLDLKSDEVRSVTNLPDRVEGLDGKSYPAKRRRPQHNLETQRGQIIAAAGVRKKYSGGPTNLVGQAKAQRDYKGGTVARNAASIIVSLYNKGRRTGQVDPI